MSMIVRRWVASLTACVIALSLQACGGPTVAAVDAGAGPGPDPSVTAVPGVDDTPRPDLAAFLKPFGPGGALIGPVPRSIEEAARDSTLVVAATISAVVPGPVIDDPMPGELHRIEILLKPAGIIRGRVEPGLTSIRVAFCCTSSTKSDPTGLSVTKADVPTRQAMWFLRWSAAPLPAALDVGQKQTPSPYDRATWPRGGSRQRGTQGSSGSSRADN